MRSWKCPGCGRPVQWYDDNGPMLAKPLDCGCGWEDDDNYDYDEPDDPRWDAFLAEIRAALKGKC